MGGAAGRGQDRAAAGLQRRRRQVPRHGLVGGGHHSAKDYESFQWKRNFVDSSNDIEPVCWQVAAGAGMDNVEYVDITQLDERAAELRAGQ